MKALIYSVLPLTALLAATPAVAQLGTTVNEPAPGYSSLLGANYGKAEREIRSANVSAYDPARSINLGVALAKTGRADEAAAQFRSVLLEDDVEMVVANGSTAMSHDVARRALAALQDGTFSR
jgi:Flp pilus assembly protein TadD